LATAIKPSAERQNRSFGGTRCRKSVCRPFFGPQDFKTYAIEQKCHQTSNSELDGVAKRWLRASHERRAPASSDSLEFRSFSPPQEFEESNS
jgi:hypothetical protein